MIKQFFIIGIILLLAAASAFAQGEGIDPSTRAPNARVIGLGRAYVGLSDDSAAIYFNPAGIARQTAWGLSTMSGKFLDDYSFLSFSGYYPTNYGVIGLGYGGYSIGGAFPTTIEAGSNPSDPIYIVDTTQPLMSNYNNVLTLSYASTLDRFLSRYISFSDKIDLGASFKLFSSGLSGDHITSGSATGQELDAGIMYNPVSYARVGAVIQNLLPTSMGGKITYVSGHTESYPALLKLGGMVKILGNEDSLRSFYNQDVMAMLDLDSRITGSSDPMLYHLGVEWKPYPIFAIRLGIDQSLADNGAGKNAAVSNMTYGLGLNYSNFRFDYAYHQFANLPIDTSYFSLSYAPPLPRIGEKVVISEPKDKTIMFEQTVMVKGSVNDAEIKQLEINNSVVEINKAKTFAAEAPVVIGKNKLTLQAYGARGKIAKPLAAKNVRVLRVATFSDVPAGYWVRQQVGLVSMLDIITGYPDKTFRPEGNITRAEMAALLMRSQGASPSTSLGTRVMAGKFKDVDAKHWASKYINDAAAGRVVEGYPDGTFGPKGDITRAEGLAMIARFAQVTREVYSQKLYPDVASTYWAAPIIAGSNKAGLLEFLKGKPFEPKRKLTRAEAVEVLYRTRFVKGLLEKDLLNWDSY